MTSADLEVYEQGQAVTLFRTDDPAEVVQRATDTAGPLAAVIDKQRLAVGINGRKYVKVEGWTLLGTMLGVFPITAWSRSILSMDGATIAGWEARVEARTKDGLLVGAAEAMCLRSEQNWRSRDEYALRSMAQTRATSKALRQPLGFVMTFAGYEATPAEEMDNTPRSQPPSTPAEAGEPTASPEQLTKLHTVISRLEAHGQDKSGIRDVIFAEYGITSTKSLTMREAHETIDRLERLLGEVSNGQEGLPFS